MKLLIPISEVPTYSKVTKRTGDKLYEVRDSFTIFGVDQKSNREIKADSGTRLLISVDSISISSVPNDLEVLWEASPDELQMFLENQQ